MATVEEDAVKAMLQSLEHLLDSVDQTSTLASQLLDAQKTDKPLSPATLTYYDEQLAALGQQREQMRTVIARWWTLVEEPH